MIAPFHAGAGAQRANAMSKLLTYSCSYTCPYGNRFPTQVIATPDTIKDVLARRNIDESLDDCVPIRRSPYLRPLCDLLGRDGVTPKTLHHAVFIGWQALKSGAANADDILGDCGLVHEMVHALQGRANEAPPFAIGRSFEDLVEMAHRIECAIPGSVLNASGEPDAGEPGDG